MRLLSVSSDAKTVKGEKRGYLTGILYLAPADTAGVGNLCPHSTPGCRATCLFTAGRAMVFPAIIKARIARTKLLKSNQLVFHAQLDREIACLVKQAERRGLTPCVRLNGTSDLPELASVVSQRWPSVQFYDYTKVPRPELRRRANYHITFSRSETNWRLCELALSNGVNVAVVFDVKRGEPLPDRYEGYRVLDGDASDLRFLDKHFSSHGIIIGLRAKGKARRDTSGFVVKL